jgi:hypothetical protein
MKQQRDQLKYSSFTLEYILSDKPSETNSLFNKKVSNCSLIVMSYALFWNSIKTLPYVVC